MFLVRVWFYCVILNFDKISYPCQGECNHYRQFSVWQVLYSLFPSLNFCFLSFFFFHWFWLVLRMNLQFLPLCLFCSPVGSSQLIEGWPRSPAHLLPPPLLWPLPMSSLCRGFGSFLADWSFVWLMVLEGLGFDRNPSELQFFSRLIWIWFLHFVLFVSWSFRLLRLFWFLFLFFLFLLLFRSGFQSIIFWSMCWWGFEFVLQRFKFLILFIQNRVLFCLCFLKYTLVKFSNSFTRFTF